MNTYIGKFLRSYLTNWVSLMSGLASVAFTFWGVLTEPAAANLKTGLWVISASCLIFSSYWVWAAEHAEVERLQSESNKELNQIIAEFEEIRTNILLNTLEPFLAAELKRLKAFLHKHPGLLNIPEIADFYRAFIAPKEIHLQYGAALHITQTEYKKLLSQMSQIDLRANLIAAEQ